MVVVDFYPPAADKSPAKKSLRSKCSQRLIILCLFVANIFCEICEISGLKLSVASVSLVVLKNPCQSTQSAVK